MSDETNMGDQEKLDELILERRFDELQIYIQDKEDYVSGLMDIMLNIGNLEKEYAEGDIWDDIYDSVSAITRYLTLSRCMERLISGKEMPDEVVNYLRDQVSAWAMASYILLTRDGIDVAKIFIGVIAFDRKHNILSETGKTVVKTNLQQEILGFIANKEFCIAQKLIVSYGGGILQSEEEEYVKKQAEAVCKVAEQRLYAPTMLACIGEFYFIVDSLHNRVLYSPEINLPLAQWRILDASLCHPHSVSGDGNIILVDNTEYNTVCIYKRFGEEYKKVNETGYLGGRPCKIIRDAEKGLYWVLCSAGGEVVGMSVDESGEYVISYKQNLSEMEGSSFAGFSLINHMLYMISSLGIIAAYRWGGLKWAFAGQVSVPNQYSGVNDLMYLNGKYYLTACQKKQQAVFPALIQVDDLGRLQNGKGIDIHEKCQMKGVPYFISQVGSGVFIPEVGANNRIVSYDCDLQPLETIFDFGGALWEDAVYSNAGMC